ncbi:YggS family pyridoxal phosphate-dependent enzyme [Pelagibacteraceae bacterium]|nr:YggS family pyridoxal phosphate-dependent enzyme [Pelagibacteraceae bacterium]
MFNIEKYQEIANYLKKNSKSAKIIAISKNHSKESVIQAIDSGVNIFGENRVNEANTKFSQLKSKYPQIKLHLTGPLQSNKVKLATSLFDVFHTLDREKIAKEFYKNKEKVKNKKIFIQVNIGEEKTKSGIPPKDVPDFISYCKIDLNLNIVGLMCIPPVDENPNEHFNNLQILAKKNKLDELSIGMSNDYMQALDYNPTYIRLGTILFGKRE